MSRSLIYKISLIAAHILLIYLVSVLRNYLFGQTLLTLQWIQFN